jgi:hypothetical protein
VASRGISVRSGVRLFVASIDPQQRGMSMNRRVDSVPWHSCVLRELVMIRSGAYCRVRLEGARSEVHVSRFCYRIPNS